MKCVYALLFGSVRVGIFCTSGKVIEVFEEVIITHVISIMSGPPVIEVVYELGIFWRYTVPAKVLAQLFTKHKTMHSANA